MLSKLSDISEIRVGALFKKGVIDEGKGIPVIQIRDVSQGLNVAWSEVPRVKFEVPPKNYLKNGDILFLAKGIENHAIVMKGLNEPIIATSHFIYIKPKSTVDSDFLALQLNSKRSEDFFKQHFRGSHKKHITKGDLSTLVISVPSLEIQRTIVKIAEDYELTQKAFDKLNLLTEDLVDAMTQEDNQALEINIEREELILNLVSSLQQTHAVQALLNFIEVSKTHPHSKKDKVRSRLKENL
jgi:restriction endonuclease S subunit